MKKDLIEIKLDHLYEVYNFSGNYLMVCYEIRPGKGSYRYRTKVVKCKDNIFMPVGFENGWNQFVEASQMKDLGPATDFPEYLI